MRHHPSNLDERPPRAVCYTCRKAEVVCYCRMIRPFESLYQFVILIHPDEAKRGVATGRMAHLCLRNSLLLKGSHFAEDERVDEILNDPSLYPVVLYPSRNAIDIDGLTREARAELFPKDRKVVIFVIDSTWGSARRMWRLSPNLHSLPVIRFTPVKPSGFLVRKQPRVECVSTLEAIHRLIDLFEEPKEPTSDTRPHDNLIEVFQSMVRTQLVYGQRKLIRGVRR